MAYHQDIYVSDILRHPLFPKHKAMIVKVKRENGVQKR